MEKYRIRAKEIKEKMKYVKEILKRELSSEEEEKVKNLKKIILITT